MRRFGLIMVSGYPSSGDDLHSFDGPLVYAKIGAMRAGGERHGWREDAFLQPPVVAVSVFKVTQPFWFFGTVTVLDTLVTLPLRSSAS